MPIAPHARAWRSFGMAMRTITSAPALHSASAAKKANPVAAAHHAAGRRGRRIMETAAVSSPAHSRVVGRAPDMRPTRHAPASIPTAMTVSTVPIVDVGTCGRRIGLTRVCTNPIAKVRQVMRATRRRTAEREATARQPAASWARKPLSSARPR